MIQCGDTLHPSNLHNEIMLDYGELTDRQDADAWASYLHSPYMHFIPTLWFAHYAHFHTLFYTEGIGYLSLN